MPLYQCRQYIRAYTGMITYTTIDEEGDSITKRETLEIGYHEPILHKLHKLNAHTWDNHALDTLLAMDVNITDELIEKGGHLSHDYNVYYGPPFNPSATDAAHRLSVRMHGETMNMRIGNRLARTNISFIEALSRCISPNISASVKNNCLYMRSAHSGSRAYIAVSSTGTVKYCGSPYSYPSLTMSLCKSIAVMVESIHFERVIRDLEFYRSVPVWPRGVDTKR